MKEIIINGCLNIIKKKFPEYDNEKLEIIEYGLLSIYLLVTKLIIISLIAITLNIFKEFIIFLLIYNVIRTFSFGLHATKSYICLIVSSIIFILVPYISTFILIPNNIKLIIGLILVCLFFKNAPADTIKRPIVSKRRRLFFKYTSTIIAIIYIASSIIIPNQFISNSFIFALIVQACMISPLIYKIFGLPYNNYLNYKAANV